MAGRVGTVQQSCDQLKSLLGWLIIVQSFNYPLCSCWLSSQMLSFALLQLALPMDSLIALHGWVKY